MIKIYRFFKSYLKKSDTPLLVLCLISSAFGLVVISSAIRYTESNSSLYVQIGAIALGLIVYFLVSLLDVDIIADRWKGLTFMGLLLIASLSVLGTDVGGNKAWIRFGGIGIQPAELVKPIFIITIAHLIVRFRERGRLNHPLSILALLLIFGAHFALIIVVSSDLGSALVYFFVFVVMLFIAGLKWYWIAGGLTALVAMAPYIWNHLSEYQQQRIIAPYDPSVDPTGQNVLWQTNMSKTALASGGVFGTGLYQGPQTQSGFVPLQQSDFIYSVIGEELGFVGCVAVMLLLVAIIVRCVQVGLRSRDRLGALVCVGIAAMVAFQTFENIGMCIGVAPVIGLTLPFFSYGGSSIVTMFAAMGIVSGVKMKPKPSMFLKW